jgi:hypothetical protein
VCGKFYLSFAWSRGYVGLTGEKYKVHSSILGADPKTKFNESVLSNCGVEIRGCTNRQANVTFPLCFHVMQIM